MSVEHIQQVAIVGAGENTVKLEIYDYDGKKHRVVLPVSIEVQRYAGERIGRTVDITVRLSELGERFEVLEKP